MTITTPPSISLQDFVSIANRASSPDQALKVKGNVLSEGGALTTKAAKREAIDAFLKAIRAEYGDQVADMLNIAGLRLLREAGKPLTARIVNDMTRAAEAEQMRVKEHNLKEVEEFLGKPGDVFLNKDNPLAKAVAELCKNAKVTSQGDKELLLGRVYAFLGDKASKGGFASEIISQEALKAGVARGLSGYTGLAFEAHHVAIKSSEALPGMLEDKLYLADLGLSGISLKRAIAALGAMREIQAEGKLTLETIHKALFKENAPVGRSDSDLLDAIKTRSEKEYDDLVELIKGDERDGISGDWILVGGDDKKRALVEDWVMHMPWDRLASLIERPGTVTLRDVSTMIDFQWSGEDRNNPDFMASYIRLDVGRVGIKEPPTLPIPTFSFELPDGSGGTYTETIEVGDSTRGIDFNDDMAARAAYRSEADQTKGEVLEKFCRELCGADATDRQLAKTMLCLNQAALLPLLKAAALAGTSFNEHSNVSVHLSRNPDGSIQANFSSPIEARDARGHFSMSLKITPNGDMNVEKFELVPPKDVRDARSNEAIRARRVAQNEIAVLCATEVFARVKARAQELAPGATLDPEAWRVTLQALARSRDAELIPLSKEERLIALQPWIDNFFASLTEAASMVPENQRDLFISGCLLGADVPDKVLLPTMLQMSQSVAAAFGDILKAKNENEVEALLNGLASAMQEATSTDNPDFVGKDEAFFATTLALSMRLGFMSLVGQDKPEVFAKALTRPGPFSDTLYTLFHPARGSSVGESGRRVVKWFGNGMSGILPDAILSRFDGINIRERDLSLSRQREIFGEGKYAVRGATVAHPDLARLNKELGDEMVKIREFIRADTQRDLRMGPGNEGGTRQGLRTNSGLSDLFVTDFARGGVFVDGRYHHLTQTGTTEEKFIALFPDPLTAHQISNLAAQNLPGFIYALIGDALRGKGSVSKETGELLDNYSISNLNILGNKPTVQQNIRIDTIDAGEGRYRLTGLYSMATDNPASGVERFMFEVSVDVNLGAPNLPLDQRPLATVENTSFDILIRGREVVPGEE